MVRGGFALYLRLLNFHDYLKLAILGQGFEVSETP